MTRMRRVEPCPGYVTLVMPTGAPGRDESSPAGTGAPAGPSRSPDSDSSVTRVLRSIGVHILYMRRVVQRSPRFARKPDFGAIRAPIAPGPTKLGGSDRDLDSLGGEAAHDALPELVLDEELVRERPDLAGERELEGEVAEARNEPRCRRRLRQQAGHCADRLGGLLDEEALD